MPSEVVPHIGLFRSEVEPRRRLRFETRHRGLRIPQGSAWLLATWGGVQ